MKKYIQKLIKVFFIMKKRISLLIFGKKIENQENLIKKRKKILKLC